MNAATNTDIAALRAAIDAGDYDVLTVLADVLEDMGDARTEQLRLIISKGWKPEHSEGWEIPRKVDWRWWSREKELFPNDLPRRVFSSIYYEYPEPEEEGIDPSRRKWSISYGTASEAYLDLAAALAGQPRGVET